MFEKKKKKGWDPFEETIPAILALVFVGWAFLLVVKACACN